MGVYPIKVIQVCPIYRCGLDKRKSGSQIHTCGLACRTSVQPFFIRGQASLKTLSCRLQLLMRATINPFARFALADRYNGKILPHFTIVEVLPRRISNRSTFVFHYFQCYSILYEIVSQNIKKLPKKSSVFNVIFSLKNLEYSDFFRKFVP